MNEPNLVPWERRAYNFARNAHAGQLDDCGKDYFESHILQVVLLVKQITDNPLIITTTYLHDTLEDTSITHEDLQDNFLDPVADWVMELTHEGQKDSYGYYFPRLKTKECIIIKFADRLSNLSRMEAWDEQRQQQYLNKSVFWKSTKPDINIQTESKDGCTHDGQWQYISGVIPGHISKRICSGCNRVEQIPDWVKSDDDYFRWKISTKEEQK